MSGLRQIGLIAYRDFMQRAKSRAFLASMVIIVGLVAAVGPLMALEMRDPPPYDVGAVGSAPPQLGVALSASAAIFDRSVDLTTYPDITAGEAALEEGRSDVLIVDGAELVWNEEPSLQLASIVTGAVQGIDRQQLIADLGLDPAEASELLSPAPLDSRTLTEPDPEAGPKQVAAYAGSFVLYISIIMFGQFVMMGVMEEKSSRVVEVVLSRVRPHQLLAGKVLGIGALGLVQLIILGGAAMVMVGMFDIGDIDLSALSLSTLATITVWFLLGYAFYAVIYGALGATVSRQEDAQGAVMLPTLLVVPGFGISLFSLDSPDSVVAVIASYVPITSPMVMPVRMALGDVAWWEPVLSALIIIASVYLLVKLGGRVYRGAVLNIGAKVRLRDAWKAAAS